jgi:hypothetical protein
LVFGFVFYAVNGSLTRSRVKEEMQGNAARLAYI